jgi:serine/threonine protein kinase
MKRIGSGMYGNVYLDGDTAVKRCFYECKPNGMLNLREMDVMHRLKGHPYIVYLQKVGISNPEKITDPEDENRGKLLEKISLVMELMPTNLQKAVPKDKGMSIDEVRRIMAQILVALEYMHINRIFHRDLKPDNILYDPETGKINLCDFGMCGLEMNYSKLELEVTSLMYRAPEVFCKKRYSAHIDLWAVGCIMYFLLTGSPLINIPSDKTPDEDIIKMQKEVSSKKLFKSRFEYRTLLEGLLKIDPRDRLSATQALKSRFFDPVRAELIDPVRKDFPVEEIILERVTMDYLPERKWIKETINDFLTRFDEDDLCVYPVIFHGLEFFERYLSWARENQPSLPHGSPDSGRYLKKIETMLYLNACLFIAHKYYSVVYPVYEWEQFFPEELRTAELAAKAEEFEEFIITEVLDYSLFRFTLYEIAEWFIETPSYKHYLQILKIYLNVSSWNNGTYRRMFRELMQSKVANSY